VAATKDQNAESIRFSTNKMKAKYCNPHNLNLRQVMVLAKMISTIGMYDYVCVMIK
jgi:hypothetical protein